MRFVVAALLVMGLLAACEERPRAPDGVHRSLGLRAPDDATPRTTAGAGTSGHEERLLLPLDENGPRLAPDPTTGTTTGAPNRTEPRHGTSGTTGGAPDGADNLRMPA